MTRQIYETHLQKNTLRLSQQSVDDTVATVLPLLWVLFGSGPPLDWPVWLTDLTVLPANPVPKDQPLDLSRSFSGVRCVFLRAESSVSSLFPCHHHHQSSSSIHAASPNLAQLQRHNPLPEQSRQSHIRPRQHTQGIKPCSVCHRRPSRIASPAQGNLLHFIASRFLPHARERRTARRLLEPTDI